MSEDRDQSSSLIESDNDSEPAVQHQMNPRVEAKINALCAQTGLIMKQENGQRKYTNPKMAGQKPEKGTEIFIGKLPRDLFEDELYPVLEHYGPLFELRMMLDFNGNNRGFCFVTYKTRVESQAALKGINNFEIRKGRLLGACQSVDNCRLFVGGIPKTKKKDEIMEEMKKVTEGVVDVIVYPSAADKTKNRGFSFVEYKDHKAAAMARRKLMPGRIQLWGHQIAVDWAEPEIEVDESIMENVKILYVRNLMLHTTEDTLEQQFSAHTGKGTIERVKKIRDYAFIHFNTRDNALKAMKVMNNSSIDNAIIEVVLAKPVDRDNYVRYTRANERKAAPILQPAIQMPGGFQVVYSDPSALLANQNVYSGQPLYYQMPVAQPTASYAPQTIEQLQALAAGRSGGAPGGGGNGGGAAVIGGGATVRKPRGAGGTRPVGGRNYIGVPRTASSSGEEVREKGGILPSARESTHPYRIPCSPDRHSQPEQNSSAVIGGNMQVEQPGLAGVPIAYMPNGWQAPLLIPHNGAGVESGWMGAAAVPGQFQYQFQQPTSADGSQQYYGLPMVYHP